MSVAVLASELLVSFLSGVLGYRVYCYLKVFDADKVLEERIGYFSKSHVEILLNRSGNKYHLTVKKFFVYKFLFSILMFIVGSLFFNVVIGIIFGIPSFFILDKLIESENNKDNRKMLSDLSSLIDCVKLQMLAGVNINNLFTECYKTVRSLRLKVGLRELSASLLTGSDVTESINSFNRKFNNRFIDSFCIAISQAYKSGTGAKSLESLTNLIKTVELEIDKDQARKIDKFCDICMVVVFILALGILFCTMGIELVKSIKKI